MLTIKRVPTVLSNYQDDANTSSNSDGNTQNGAQGCGRNCLGKCCLPGMFLLFFPPPLCIV